MTAKQDGFQTSGKMKRRGNDCEVLARAGVGAPASAVEWAGRTDVPRGSSCAGVGRKEWAALGPHPSGLRASTEQSKDTLTRAAFKPVHEIPERKAFLSK